MWSGHLAFAIAFLRFRAFKVSGAVHGCAAHVFLMFSCLWCQASHRISMHSAKVSSYVECLSAEPTLAVLLVEQPSAFVGSKRSGAVSSQPPLPPNLSQ